MTALLVTLLSSRAMVHVTIYTRPFCGYCSRAVALLRKKGVAFTEVEAGFDPRLRQEMMRKSGRHTFPQIFVGDEPIGGCDEMLELDRQGALDALIGAG